MSDYISRLTTGGYTDGSYWNGADPAQAYAIAALSQQAQNQNYPASDPTTFQYYLSQFQRLGQAANDTSGGGSGGVTDWIGNQALQNIVTPFHSVADVTSGTVLSSIMTPRFIVFCVGGVLLLVAIISTGLVGKTTRAIESGAAKGGT